MGSRRLTASALPRALKCVASVVLPADEGPQGEWADRGDALHLASEGRIDEVPEKYRDEAEILDVDAFDLPPDTRREVAFALDITTGLGRELDVEGRDYESAGLSPLEVPGRSDFWGPGFIGDAKSGWRDVERAEKNAQLLVAAAANASVYDVSTVRLRVIDIRDPANPRTQSKGEVDRFDLEMFRGEMERLHEDAAVMRSRLAKGDPVEVNEGPWCRYCASTFACPAKQNMLERISSGDMSNEIVMTWAALTPANARRAYEQRQMVQMVLKEMDRRLYAYAAETPIDLGNGKVFGKRTKLGNESIDGHVAWEVLKEAYGIEVAEAACGFTVSKTSKTGKSLRGALRMVCGKGELSKAEERILDAIRERGGASRKETTTVDEHRSK